MPCMFALSHRSRHPCSRSLLKIDSRPSPLDALIASHIHLLLQLDHSSHLRRAAENEPELCQYVDRVMRYASDNLSRTD